MPKQMLIDMAQQLREQADSLEAYASELGEEEGSEEGSESPQITKSSTPNGGGDKVSLALSAMKKGMAGE